MTTSTAVRIDRLERGAFVELDINGRYIERAMFIGIVGEGDARRARFVSAFKGEGNAITEGDRKGYAEWEAYRYNGRWAYGSSAERMTVEAVL